MGHGDYRKLNDGSMNSSTYHKRDGTAARQKLKVEAKREVKAEGVQDVGEWQGHPVIGAIPVMEKLTTIGQRKEPCGECHIQPSGRCDVCGARAASPNTGEKK